MSTVALGIAPDINGAGVTPLAHRHILAAQWANTGLVDGMNVTGRNDLRYNVSAGVAVCSRGETDGKTIAYFEGGQTGAVAAGDPSNPRIDIVWVKANNALEYKDPDNYVTVGVTQGMPGANPPEPTIPAGATMLRKMKMPAGATSTSSAIQMWSADYAIPYGASLGKIAENWMRQDYHGSNEVKKFFYEQQVEFDLPSDRMLELEFKCNMSAYGVAYNDTSKRCEWAMGFQIDNKDLDHSCANFISYGAWETHETSYVTAVSKGHHTARLKCWLQNGVPPHFHYNPSQDTKDALWCGRRFIIWDRGQVI